MRSLSDHDSGVVRDIAEVAKSKCTKHTTNSSGDKISGDVKFYGNVLIKRLYRGQQDWYKADAVVDAVWDSIYFNAKSRSMVCGQKNWEKIGGTNSIHFEDVLSSPHTSETVRPEDRALSPPSSSPVENSSKRPIAIVWGGYSGLISGTATLTQGQNFGRISIVLPRGEGTCTGAYIFQTRQLGTWRLDCSKNMSATGNFEAFGFNRGSAGTGKDQSGNSVSFTIGAE